MTWLLSRRYPAGVAAKAALCGLFVVGAQVSLAQSTTAQEEPVGAASGQPEGLPEQPEEDRLTFSGLIAGGYQFLLLDDSDGGNQDGGTLTIRPSFDYALTDVDQFHLTFALAGGNAINDKSPFSFAPWGADLEDDLVDINGSDIDYLQRLWYRRTFEPAPEQSLALTVGFIDSTEYLDQNEYANDEYTQFMNETFVNRGFLPSYDWGAAVEWSAGEWSVNGVVMHVTENDDGNNFVFAGTQIGYNLDTSFGEGNYRLTLSYASDDFLDPTGTSAEPRFAAQISADQQLSEILGLWARVGWQDDAAAISFRSIYSGGLNITGGLWGREQDNIGIGYAYLDGGNAGISSAHLFESYVRFELTPEFSATLDLQYLTETPVDGGTIDGVVLGGRVVFTF